MSEQLSFRERGALEYRAVLVRAQRRVLEIEGSLGGYQDMARDAREMGNFSFANLVEQMFIPDLEAEAARLREDIQKMDLMHQEFGVFLAEAGE